MNCMMIFGGGVFGGGLVYGVAYNSKYVNYEPCITIASLGIVDTW